MLLVSLLAVVGVGGATLLTYFYDSDEILPWRICTGVCVGITTLGLIGFVLASWFGLTTKALIATLIVTGLPFLLLRQQALRARIVEDLKDTLEKVKRATHAAKLESWIEPGFYLVAATVFWYICSRTMFENVAGLFTGMDTNIGDLLFTWR